MNWDRRYIFKRIEPTHDKTYNRTCATSEDSDQTAYPCSLISIRWLHVHSTASSYPKRDKRQHLPSWVDVQADLSLRWSHRSHCRFSRALAHAGFTRLVNYMNRCWKVSWTFLTLWLLPNVVFYGIFFVCTNTSRDTQVIPDHETQPSQGTKRGGNEEQISETTLIFFVMYLSTLKPKSCADHNSPTVWDNLIIFGRDIYKVNCFVLFSSYLPWTNF